jgi:predicted ATPase
MGMSGRRHIRSSVPIDRCVGGYIKGIHLRDEAPVAEGAYPFSIPAVRKMGHLKFDAAITFFVGDNGSGKSTLVEAIAVAAGFNAEGGTKNFNFSTGPSVSELSSNIWLARGLHREETGYFLRAESVFALATEIDRLDDDPLNGGPSVIRGFGGISLHEQSHGESFLAIANNKFGGCGLYILDEPEAALSPSRQIAFLKLMRNVVDAGSQLIVATHSPILLAYPGALIYRLDEDGITKVDYEDTDHFKVTRDFLNNREAYLRHFFGEGGG